MSSGHVLTGLTSMLSISSRRLEDRTYKTCPHLPIAVRRCSGGVMMPDCCWTQVVEGCLEVSLSGHSKLDFF